MTPNTAPSTPAMQEEWLAQWNTNHTGPLTTVGVNQLGWLRIPDEDPIWSKFADPSPGENAPHIEIAITVRRGAIACVH